MKAKSSKKTRKTANCGKGCGKGTTSTDNCGKSTSDCDKGSK